MTSTHIRVVYEGPAVEDGAMDVAQLASSLLALGKLIETADEIRTGETNRVRIRVQSDVRRGSFDIGIAVHWTESLTEAAIAWAMTPKGAGTLALLGIAGVNAKDLAIVGGKGVIQVVRWLRGRQAKRGAVLNNGNVTLIVDDDQIEVSPQVVRLVEDANVRAALERFTDPLREDGVDAIKLEGEGATVERIAAEEAPAFEAAGADAPTSTERYRATFQIKRLFFEPGRKWRLSNGAQTIQAEIEDSNFWAKVDASAMAFSKEDYLVCTVRMDQWLSSAGLRTEYTIEQVIDHIPAPKQPGLEGI